MKIIFIRIVNLFMLIACVQQVRSQTMVSSRYNADPVHLNPALTADFDGAWRVNINYNVLSTMKVPFKNYMMSFDKPVYFRDQKIGVGVSAIHDETGNNFFNNEKVFVSGSYFLDVRKNLLNFGIQAGYVQSNIKLDNEIWPDQYNRLLGSFAPDIPSGENFDNSLSYVDLNAGLVWKRILPRHLPSVGLSVSHINAPKISFSGYQTHLRQVLVLHGTDEWMLTRKVYVSPSFIYKSDFGGSYLILGSSCSYVFSSSFLEKSVFGGIDLKNGYGQVNALSFYGGIKYNQWQFGASYDYNIKNSKTNLSIHGPVELYVRFTALSSRIRNFSVPCSRF